MAHRESRERGTNRVTRFILRRRAGFTIGPAPACRRWLRTNGGRAGGSIFRQLLTPEVLHVDPPVQGGRRAHGATHSSANTFAVCSLHASTARRQPIDRAAACRRWLSTNGGALELLNPYGRQRGGGTGEAAGVANVSSSGSPPRRLPRLLIQSSRASACDPPEPESHIPAFACSRAHCWNAQPSSSLGPAKIRFHTGYVNTW